MSAPPEKVARWRPQVDKWCVQLKVSQALVMAVMQMESGGNPNAKRYEPGFEKSYICSSATWLSRCKELGMSTAAVATSYGLMQLMFSTAYGYGCRSVKQALDPDQAIRLGVAHLAMLLSKYSIPEALAAYNGGTGAVEDLRQGKNTPATRYSANVMSLYERYKAGTETKSYFTPSEFACKCGCGFCKPDPRLIQTLNAIREALGKPVNVTSGCRCKAHNARVGGVTNSNHTHGTAADIQCAGVMPLNVWGLIKRLHREGKLPELAGLGIYSTFVHVDVDPKVPGRLREWDER